jgi:hypothetical protein
MQRTGRLDDATAARAGARVNTASTSLYNYVLYNYCALLPEAISPERSRPETGFPESINF